MNSEDIKRVEQSELAKPLQQDAQGDKIIQKGLDFTALLESPAWQQLEGNLRRLKEGLIIKLLDASTLKEIQPLQARIKNIDFILYNPKHYIEQSRLHTKEKRKCLKQPQPQQPL